MTRLVIRPRRWTLLLLGSTALGLATLFGAIFLHGHPGGDEGAGSWPAAAFALVGLFLALHWGRQFVAPEPLFTLDETGFSYRPGGVSTGLVRWSEVDALRDTAVLVGGGSYGPEKEPALGVILRDPEAYIARFPAPLQPLLRARADLSGTPLLIDLRHLGSQEAQVRQAMAEHLTRARR